MRKKWNKLQKLCADKKCWTEAILEADKLLDNALRRKRLKGKSMGERLVSAQDHMSNNDGVWYAHNLAKKIIDQKVMKLRKTETKKALLYFGQALKDLGALKNGK